MFLSQWMCTSDGYSSLTIHVLPTSTPRQFPPLRSSSNRDRDDSPFSNLQPPSATSSSISTNLSPLPMTVGPAVQANWPVSPMYMSTIPTSTDGKAKRPRMDSSSIDHKPIVPPKRTMSDEVRLPSVSHKEPAKVNPPTNAPPAISMSSDIRPLLTREAIRKGKPVAIFKHLRMRKINGETVPPLFSAAPSEVAEILSALAEHATSEYLRTMADDKRYTSVFQKWLKMALKDPELWEPAIVPVLLVRSPPDGPSDTDSTDRSWAGPICPLTFWLNTSLERLRGCYQM